MNETTERAGDTERELGLTTAGERANKWYQMAEQNIGLVVVQLASLYERLEREEDRHRVLAEQLGTAQAELETAKGLLVRAKTEVHNAYCEGDEEGNWGHVPMCDELDAAKGESRG